MYSCMQTIHCTTHTIHTNRHKTQFTYFTIISWSYHHVNHLEPATYEAKYIICLQRMHLEMPPFFPTDTCGNQTKQNRKENQTVCNSLLARHFVFIGPFQRRVGSLFLWHPGSQTGISGSEHSGHFQTHSQPCELQMVLLVPESST